MKFVLNRCFGGFSLSDEALAYLGTNDRFEYDSYEKRNDEKLVACVQELGERANTYFSNLRIVSIPDSATDWEIDEYDGLEKLIYVMDGKIHHVGF